MTLIELLKKYFNLKENFNNNDYIIAYNKFINLFYDMEHLGLFDTKEINSIIDFIDTIDNEEED